MRKLAVVAAVAGALALTGCAHQTGSDAKDSVNVFCKGSDLVYVFKEDRAGGLFVVPDHKECAK